jgi:hypothetical protein
MKDAATPKTVMVDFMVVVCDAHIDGMIIFTAKITSTCFT